MSIASITADSGDDLALLVDTTGRYGSSDGQLPPPQGRGDARGQGIVASGTLCTMLPVPEPETYAMLLAGLGMMGAVMRKRKSA